MDTVKFLATQRLVVWMQMYVLNSLCDLNFNSGSLINFAVFLSCGNLRLINYHMRAIITRGLYIFYPIFHFCLYWRAVSVTNNLCTYPGNLSIFGSKMGIVMAGIHYLIVFDLTLVSTSSNVQSCNLSFWKKEFVKLSCKLCT